MKKFTSKEIKEFVSKPLFDEKIILHKDSSWPRISIVTPSYNQAEFLERTILSVLNQNYPNLEYIIIDGGSTDGSVEIIKKYEQFINYWVSEKDKGQSDAINKGFEKSTGEILAWQNSDDVYLDGAFRKVVKVFEKHSDADLVFGDIYLIDKMSAIIRDIRYVPFSLSCLVHEGWNVTNQAAFWRQKVAKDVGMFDENLQYGMDFDWFVRVAKSGNRYRNIHDFLGGFRIHEVAKGTMLSETVGKSEHAKVRLKYGLNNSNMVLKLYCLFRKSLWYMFQGDWDYALRGLVKRCRHSLPF